MQFSRPLRSIYPFVIAGLLALPAQAQDTADPDQVLAEVNGEKITLGHVIAQRATLPPQYDQVDGKILFEGLLNQLVQQSLLAQSKDTEPSKLAQLSLDNQRRAIIADENSRDLLTQAIDEAELQSLYDERYASSPKETEYNASHILVETEQEAKDLIAALDGGADFAEQAKEKSIGPSGANGGDLGWFGQGTMVAPFFEGVQILEAGNYSAEPVQTDFGWHVILLKETRDIEPPTFGQTRGALEEELRTLAFEDYLIELENNADVVRADMTGIDPTVINNLDLLEN